jgi:hypothetical protein
MPLNDIEVGVLARNGLRIWNNVIVATQATFVSKNLLISTNALLQNLALLITGLQSEPPSRSS